MRTGPFASALSRSWPSATFGRASVGTQEDHPNLVNADAAPVGHGVLVWIEVDDFDATVGRRSEGRSAAGGGKRPAFSGG